MSVELATVFVSLAWIGGVLAGHHGVRWLARLALRRRRARARSRGRK